MRRLSKKRDPISVHTKIALQNPADSAVRSNIMWITAWALNTLVAKGKSTDGQLYMIGQAISAYTDATHGMNPSAVSLPYDRPIMPYSLKKLKNLHGMCALKAKPMCKWPKKALPL